MSTPAPLTPLDGAYQIRNYRPKKPPALLKQMYDVVELLKSDRRPYSITEIERAADLRLHRESELFRNMLDNPRLTYDSGSQSFQYKPLYNLKDRFQIRDFLNTVMLGHGVLRTDLDDCYIGAAVDVQTLIEGGDAFSVRNSENHAEIVFGNFEPGVKLVEDAVRRMWTGVDFPSSMGTKEFEEEIRKVGLNPAVVEADESVKTEGGKEEKDKADAKKRMRRIKLTNVHIGVQHEIAGVAPVEQSSKRHHQG